MEVTHLNKNKYRGNTANTIPHVQDNREERDDIELYKTMLTDDQVYENTPIAVSNLDMANSGLNEYYETLQKTTAADNEGYENKRRMTVSASVNANSGLNEYNATLQTTSIEDNKSRVSKSFCMTDGKQKIMLLVLVITGVLISSVSLVIALTIQEKAQAVDGSWSSWELWEACSSTCGVGMQRRHRNCTSRTPLENGHQCHGVDNEHRLCMPGPCLTQAVDGSWSSWESWEACSSTCDVGMQRRHRNCTPLENRHQCHGVDNEHRLCMPGPCLNGGWSAWGSWGSCSASCSVGFKSRFRTCTYPRPSLFGNFCEGDNMQVEICESGPCKETHVAFSVYKSSVTNNSREHTVVFTKTLLNEGRAYDETTGVFTAPFNGLYQFNGQICTVVGKDADYTLKSERMAFASGEHRTPSDASDGKCTSFSAVASVLKYEKVWIKSHHLFQNDNDWNSFSGILIHKT